MIPHDSLNDVQSQARTFTHWLSSEERIKYAPSDFWWDTGAAVMNSTITASGSRTVRTCRTFSPSGMEHIALIALSIRFVQI